MVTICRFATEYASQSVSAGAPQYVVARHGRSPQFRVLETAPATVAGCRASVAEGHAIGKRRLQAARLAGARDVGTTGTTNRLVPS